MSQTQSIGWGTRVAILYLGFVALIITLVILSHREKTDLVTKEYYSEELQFQDRINAISNLESTGGKVSVVYDQQVLTLSFPQYFIGKKVTGTIHFYRPSDSSKDSKMPLELNKEIATQVINLQHLEKGSYILKLNFTSEGKNYYQQENLFKR
jgi:nitrogen fixation protein FixH